jgi:hypothetical protein
MQTKEANVTIFIMKSKMKILSTNKKGDDGKSSSSWVVQLM